MKYAFTNGKVITGEKDCGIKENSVILTDGEKITSLVEKGAADISGYKEIDLKGGYIMPGLINMHVHLAGNGKPQKSSATTQSSSKPLWRTA